MPRKFCFTSDELAVGQMICRELDGEQVLFANVDGVIYAVSAMCTHEDSPLCLGALKGGSVMCSLHGSFFDLKTGTKPQYRLSLLLSRLSPITK